MATPTASKSTPQAPAAILNADPVPTEIPIPTVSASPTPAVIRAAVATKFPQVTAAAPTVTPSPIPPTPLPTATRLPTATPKPEPTPTPDRQAELKAKLAWAQDGLTDDESHALASLAGIASSDEDLGRTIADYLWVTDDIASNENGPLNL